ncbi:MAG: right-handed parallel beta-helix repeat-containing protein [Planctomycetota bacterium]
MRLLVPVAVAGLAFSAHADILRVSIDASSGGDGSSWGRAFDSLSDALAAARPGDELWVAQGVYKPDTPGGRDATFTVPQGVQLYGGFRRGGGETSRNQRDFENNVTELSGSGVSYTVVTIAGTNTVIDGFLITDGLADGSGGAARSRGAGVFARDVAPIIRNSTFTGHESSSDGAAISLFGNSTDPAHIEGCAISQSVGSFAVATDFPLVMTDSEISSNQSAALWLEGTGGYFITGTRIRDNDAPVDTVRVELTSQSSFTQIIDCTIERNTASQSGGIAYRGRGDHEIISSRIRRNEQTVTVGSGGIYMVLDQAADSLAIENTTIVGNIGASTGGGIRKDSPAELNVINATIVGNSVPGPTGAGANITSGITRFRNTIVYDNIFTGPGGSERASILVAQGDVVNTEYSCIQFLGSSPGLGTITFFRSIAADPGLIDADGNDNIFGTADDNLRPAEGSFVIDRGNSLFVGPLVFSDIYGQPRFRDDTGTDDTGEPDGTGFVVDIGAAEFQGTTPGEDCPADTNGDGLVTPQDFTSWVLAYNTQAPACDQNGDGLCTPQDFTAWVANFNAGC